MDGEDSRMVKQKETFQPWRKPKSKGKLGTRANPSEDVTAPSSSKAKKKVSNSKPRQGISAKPKGLKTTVVVTATTEDVPAVHIDLEDEQAAEGNSKEGGRGMSLDVEGSIQERHEADVVFGRKLPVQEDRVGSDIFLSGPQVPTSDSGGGQRVTQRPGKEIARPLSPASDREFESSPFSKSNRDHSGRGKRHRSWDPSFSKLESLDRRGSRYKSQQGRSGLYQRSRSESRSPMRGRRRHRRTHMAVDRRRGGNAGEGVSRMRKSMDRSDSDESEEYSPRGSEAYRRNGSLRGAKPESSAREVKHWRNRDLSDDDESSDNSAEEDQYRRSSAKDKGVKQEMGIPETETMKRRKRRQRQGQRETERMVRERQGLRGQYLSVDHRGHPYGFGISAWRQELNKLSTALDPSISDIRFQPEGAMSTLRRRLKDNFEYGAPVDRDYIRKLAGKCVTQRRSRIISSLKNGKDCPSGLDREIWRRLDRMRLDPNQDELSHRMKSANAARVSKGRTGPKGEEGCRENLYKELGREPDPEELQEEMRRHKGYSGLSSKKKESRDRLPSPARDISRSGGVGRSEIGDDGSLVRRRSLTEGVVEGTQLFDVNYVRKMEQELEMFHNEMRVAVTRGSPDARVRGGPSTSRPLREQESNVTRTRTRAGRVSGRVEDSENCNEDSGNEKEKPPKNPEKKRK